MKPDAHFGTSSSLLVTNGALAVFLCGVLASLRFRAQLLAGLCLFFLLLGVLARWWGARAIRNVTIRMECTRRRLFPGQETTIRYQVENAKLLPLVWLELSQNGPERECLVPDEAFETYTPPYQGTAEDGAKRPPFLRQAFSFVGSFQTLEVDSTWLARRRGVYVIDQLLARSGDGFGLVQEEQALPADQLPVLAVYPRQVPVDLSLFLSPQWDCVSGRKGWMEDNTVLRGSREYQPGDNWKHINWRMAAREQGLPINLYQSIQPRGMRFILDGESFCGREEALERTLEILASILTGLDGAGVPCSLTLSKSRRFPAMTLSWENGAGIDQLLLHLAGYDCLARHDTEKEETPTRPVYFPSLFPTDVLPQSGSTFLVTYSGASIPAALLPRLDPGKVWIFSVTDRDAAVRAGFRCMELETFVKGGTPL